MSPPERLETASIITMLLALVVLGLLMWGVLFFRNTL